MIATTTISVRAAHTPEARAARAADAQRRLLLLRAHRAAARARLGATVKRMLLVDASSLSLAP